MNKIKVTKAKVFKYAAILLIEAIVIIAILIIAGKHLSKRSYTENSNALSTAKQSVSTKSYNTTAKSFTISVDKKKIKLSTPDKWYNLTKESLDAIASYYNKSSLSAANFVSVGDEDTTTSSKVMIRVAPYSTTKKMEKILGVKDIPDTLKAPAYVFMKTGKVPSDAPDEFKAELVWSKKINGVTYKAYWATYITKYASVDSEGSTQTEQSVKTEELVAYSDTKDPIEFIVSDANPSKETDLSYLKEVLGGE